jgi:hypothetical protein
MIGELLIRQPVGIAQLGVMEDSPHPAFGQIDLIQTKAFGKRTEWTYLRIGHESGPAAAWEREK